jgi:hypothetical protein
LTYNGKLNLEKAATVDVPPDLVSVRFRD